MKYLKLLLATLVCVLAFSVEGKAQYYFMDGDTPNKSMEMGVQVGASYMHMRSGGQVSTSPHLGIRGALVMALVWQEDYALQMELAYLHNNIETSREGVQYDVKSSVVEIPVMFSYRGLGSMRFNVGPVLSLAGTGRYSTSHERVEFGRLRPTLGYTAGVGVSLSQHIVVDARFTGSFARTDNYFEGVEFRSSAYWATLGVSYLF